MELLRITRQIHCKAVEQRATLIHRQYNRDWGTSYSTHPIDPYLTSPPVTKSWRRHWPRTLHHCSWGWLDYCNAVLCVCDSRNVVRRNGATADDVREFSHDHDYHDDDDDGDMLWNSCGSRYSHCSSPSQNRGNFSTYRFARMCEPHIQTLVQLRFTQRKWSVTIAIIFRNGSDLLYRRILISVHDKFMPR